MLVKVLHVVMFLLISRLTSSLPLEAETRHRRAADDCKECPAGTFMKSCNECLPCLDNTFINKPNKEYSCLPCFMDCTPVLHMQVVSPCSKVADVVCSCMEGFICSKSDIYTKQCSECIKMQHVQTSYTTTQTAVYATNLTSSKQSPESTSDKMNNDDMTLQLSLIFIVSCVSFSIVLFYFCKRRKIDYLKKRLKQCSLRKQKEDTRAISSDINKPTEDLHAQTTHTQIASTTNTDCPTSQPATREQPSTSSGNLGPLHIYGASTVFVSLLNQFGLNGGDKDEEDLRQQPLNDNATHSPPSPTIPLSKEEWNTDISYISFPSQEQGKECHMSKEEGL